MRTNINTVYGLLVASIFLTILNAGITYHSIREKEQSTDVIIHSQKIIQSFTQLLGHMMDMEANERGYIITNDSSFLDSYATASQAVRSEARNLKRLILSKKGKTDELEEKTFVSSHAKHRDLEATLFVYKTYGKDSANSRLATKSGKVMLDTLRSLVNKLVDHEKDAISRQDLILDNNRRLDPIRFSAFALIGVTSIIAFITIVRKERRNALLLTKIKMANEGLEKKVQDRTKQLLEAISAKDHFLSIASHDLKAPINGVLGLVELMKAENEERTESDLEYLSHIEYSCKKMQRLISNILELNQIEQGLNPVKKQAVDLNIFLEKIGIEFSHQARKKNIQLNVDLMRDIIETDPDTLSRILENLLSNAIKFSPEERTVELRASRLSDYIQFDIVDQGPGIANEDVPKLFRKFQKLGNKPTNQEGSTGLGLSIVKELTKQLEGEVTVKSMPGRGTTFTVRIPAGSNASYASSTKLAMKI
jgi:signal transduction histidine kinase